MSIRVTSNGHNFTNNITTSPTKGEMVIVVIESIKAMLVPTTLIDSCSPNEHLRSAGIALEEENENVIIVEQDKTTSALIVIPKVLLSEIYRYYGEDTLITTPLLTTPIKRGHEVIIHLSADQTLLCINIFNGGDRLFAELFDVKNDSDILYWLARIGEGYDFSDYTIYIDGGDKKLLKLLKIYYKQVELCE